MEAKDKTTEEIKNILRKIQFQNEGGDFFKYFFIMGIIMTNYIDVIDIKKKLFNFSLFGY